MSGLSKDQITAAVSLIDAICTDPNAEPFLEPVDWQGLQLLDYPAIIKKPMDLDTVRQKLQSGQYQTFDDCFADIQLIWDNCKLYNMQGSDIYKICERMERSARRELNKFRTQHGLPPAPANQPTAGTKRTQQSRATALKTQTNEAPNNQTRVSHPKENLQSHQQTPATDLKESMELSNEVSTEMKVEFCGKMKKLNGDQLTKFVAFVQAKMAASLTELEGDRVQIVVDDWSRPFFDQFSAFVDDMILGSLPSKRQRND